MLTDSSKWNEWVKGSVIITLLNGDGNPAMFLNAHLQSFKNISATGRIAFYDSQFVRFSCRD